MTHGPAIPGEAPQAKTQQGFPGSDNATDPLPTTPAPPPRSKPLPPPRNYRLRTPPKSPAVPEPRSGVYKRAALVASRAHAKPRLFPGPKASGKCSSSSPRLRSHAHAPPGGKTTTPRNVMAKSTGRHPPGLLRAEPGRAGSGAGGKTVPRRPRPAPDSHAHLDAPSPSRPRPRPPCPSAGLRPQICCYWILGFQLVTRTPQF